MSRNGDSTRRFPPLKKKFHILTPISGWRVMAATYTDTKTFYLFDGGMLRVIDLSVIQLFRRGFLRCDRS